jgi:hypothetical protein
MPQSSRPAAIGTITSLGKPLPGEMAAILYVTWARITGLVGTWHHALKIAVQKLVTLLIV